MRRESLSWKCDSILSLYLSLAALTARRRSVTRCFVFAHVSRQKTSVVCGSAMVNRITDWSVHPRFLIGECPYRLRFQWLAQVSVLMKLTATSVNSLTSDELARNMSQSTSSRDACSIASEWEDQRVTSLSTGGSWVIRCLYSGVRKMATWSDLPKAGSERAL